MFRNKLLLRNMIFFAFYPSIDAARKFKCNYLTIKIKLSPQNIIQEQKMTISPME